LANALTVKELHDLVKKFSSSVLCVLETQIQKSRVEWLKRMLGYDDTFAVSSFGRSGGLRIFWNNEIKLEILSYSQYHIDTSVSEKASPPSVEADVCVW
jgi:hypothetical protein